MGNRVTGYEGGVIYCQESSPVFANCTIAGNWPGSLGAGLRASNSPVLVLNSIMWGNGPAEVLATGPALPVLAYTDVAGGWPGVGNLKADPLFAMPGYWADPADLTKPMAPSESAAVWVPGDYHLMSKAGRWDPVVKAWVADPLASPCVDLGDPLWPVGSEPAPNGGRINMGAYGGTRQASLSSAQ